ncbi:hypothetical protein C7S18_11590 [Ahniella affigens]|uniref:Response regulatory domain-containing protein n=1 Tax=Ahniella affigens TaxID=2021234 RepID=A0A2P1PSH5_9GAMM|nr:response regulator [Ahniella affigens]AVP97799.1 hypothetical protein C7S18_11590 [Ahniella affigens]
MGQSPPIARAILLEDDAIASEVLTRHLQALGFTVFAYDRLSNLQRGLPDCLPATVALIDLAVPDGDGGTALLWLRGHCGTIVATSADWTPASEQARLESGFAACLGKPCSLPMLRSALVTAAGPVGMLTERDAQGSTLMVFDDAAALSALGNVDAVLAMRGLFRDELLSLQPQLLTAAATGAWTHQRSNLHRLAASSGFVGAKALQAAVHDLQASMHPEAGNRVLAAVAACLAALSPGLGPAANTRAAQS